MILAVLLATTLATATPAPQLIVVDERGDAIVAAHVQPLANDRVRISAPGFETVVVILSPRGQRVVLHRAIPLIASVRVATGSLQSLHQLPVAAAQLDRATIRTSSAFTSDAVLRALPGFDRSRSNSMFSNYGLLRVSFAGAGNDRGVVLVDGIPAQDGFGGQIDWAAYPPAQLQNAELLLGAGSALYGAGAVGGVLALQSSSLPPAGSPPSGELAFSAGSSAFSRQSAALSGSIAPHLRSSFFVAQQRMQYWDLPPAYQSPIDRQAQSNAAATALRLQYDAGTHETFELGMRGAWDDQYEGRSNYTFSRRLTQIDARATHSGAKSSLQTTAYARTAFIVNQADRFPTQPGVLRYVQNVPTNETGASAVWNLTGTFSTFEVRVDARHVLGESEQFGQGGVFQNSGSGSQNLYGVAAQQTFHNARFEAIAGARLDGVRAYDEALNSGTKTTYPATNAFLAVSPRVAVRYDVTRTLAVRASAGSGFRAPFLNELVRGYFIGNVAYEPNPQLVPERSVTASGGVDYAAGFGRISVDAFDTTVRDAIMFRTIDPAHQLRSNVAQTRTDGYTIAFTRSAGACARVNANFTNQYARVTYGPTAILGNRLQYVPQASGSVGLTALYRSVAIGASVAYLGQTYADDLNTQPLGTAIVAGVNVGVPLGEGVMLKFTADNLTGARYLSSIDRYGTPLVAAVELSVPLAGNTQPQNDRCVCHGEPVEPRQSVVEAVRCDR